MRCERCVTCDSPIALMDAKLSLAQGPISTLPPLNTAMLLFTSCDVAAAAAADDEDAALIVATSPCMSMCTYLTTASHAVAQHLQHHAHVICCGGRGNTYNPSSAARELKLQAGAGAALALACNRGA